MGYLLVISAGILQGAFVFPMKFTKKWVWEDIWLVFATTGYLIFPWLIALFTIPHLFSILAATSARSLLLVELFGLGWGLGGITFGLGVDRLGMALAITIIIGVTATAGALIPMAVLAPEKLLQPQGLLTLASLALVLIGLSLGSWGGKLREPKQSSSRNISQTSFTLGLGICIAAGLLSACGNLAFAFGTECIQKAIEQGAAESVAGNSLLAPLGVPKFVCNAAYCVWLLRKNKTASLLLLPGTRLYWALGALMGFLWIAGMSLYAPGIRRLGSLGTSVGWAAMMSMMVITANILGLASGEWKGASRKAYTFAFAGVAILILAIVVVGYANQL
jgi:L-rhamnose-H+ transport protein